jgi:glycosyltransferase involved in cell wall biosynthesis
MRWLTEKYSNGITGCSKAVLDAYYPGWKARTDKCFRVCYYGIDCNKFAVSDDRVVVRKELGIDENAIVVGHVGRFCKSKNHKVIIDVAKIITQKDPNINFVLVGDGELKTEIEEYSESQGLAGKVIFTGKRSDIPRLLSSFDVFFFPSIDEGFSVVIMEVQAAGLAIVASSIAGLREAVAPEYLDFLVAPEDTISFSRLLLELIRNPEKRKILADRGKQFVLNFTMQASVERFQRVYMALLSED